MNICIEEGKYMEGDSDRYTVTTYEKENDFININDQHIIRKSDIAYIKIDISGRRFDIQQFSEKEPLKISNYYPGERFDSEKLIQVLGCDKIESVDIVYKEEEN